MNKPTCKACSALAKAIDAYIAKVDDDLEGELESAGYAEASESVAGASVLEEELTKILGDQSEALADLIKNAGSLEKAKALLDQFFDDDETREKLENLFKEYFSDQLLDLANDYIKESDGQLVVSTLRARTTAWITNWSGQLANLMQLTSKTQMETILQNALDNGESVESVRLKLQNAGIRQEAYRARTASLTEMLRAHSVARQEIRRSTDRSSRSANRSSSQEQTAGHITRCIRGMTHSLRRNPSTVTASIFRLSMMMFWP